LKTDRAWISRLLRHPSQKRSGYYSLTTSEPARGGAVVLPVNYLH